MTNPGLDHIRRLFEYHHWAGGKTFDALAAVKPEQLDQKWGGSFGTGRALLQHVLGADRVWADRWNGTSKKLATYPPEWGGREYRDEWQRIAADQARFLAKFSQKQLDGNLTYTNLKGEEKTLDWTRVLVHVVNHGTYHRGQLTHLLRDLGLPASGTDYLYFEPQ